ncbi:MAG: histidine phosphatase family protein [Lentihominibacter sp.]|jgi:broad specificity phosphatase PhoE/CTP:molybdopterin cytidylyltransferase MocA
MRIGYNRLEAEDYGNRFGAIILAAGKSSRMGDFKPLLHVAGRTAIEGLIESAKAAGLKEIIAVTGHNREALAEVIDNCRVREVFNAGYEGGMFTSIKAGLAAAREADDAGNAAARLGWLIIPVDCPLISVRVMREVMSAVMEDTELVGDESRENKFAVATYEGKKGHPLFVPAGYVEEICAYEGPGGLKTITDKYTDNFIRVPVDEEGCILDMDTPEGYEDIKAFVAKGFAREKLELLTARKKIFLVRHGETEQHEEPVFIGQYDVPLSETGIKQAQILGERIAEAVSEDIKAELMGMDKFGREPMPAIERIYCSDLARARKTAEIICENVNRQLAIPGQKQRISIKEDPGLREISLGVWDGKPVRQVREMWPEEYERRGRDMFAFKTGIGTESSGVSGRSESFYDMQYRVIGTFREILRNDDARCIIIVAHSGVIRALENNIKGLRVDDDWESLDKGDFRMLEPFPEQPWEKASGEQPMDIKDMTMESLLEYYE